MEEKTKIQGGKREGSGRKKTKESEKRTVGFSIRTTAKKKEKLEEALLEYSKIFSNTKNEKVYNDDTLLKIISFYDINHNKIL